MNGAWTSNDITPAGDKPKEANRTADERGWPQIIRDFEKSRSHRDGIVAAVFNRQASLFQVLGMAVENRRHICGHTITENALSEQYWAARP